MSNFFAMKSLAILSLIAFIDCQQPNACQELQKYGRIDGFYRYFWPSTHPKKQLWDQFMYINGSRWKWFANKDGFDHTLGFIYDSTEQNVIKFYSHPRKGDASHTTEYKIRTEPNSTFTLIKIVDDKPKTATTLNDFHFKGFNADIKDVVIFRPKVDALETEDTLFLVQKNNSTTNKWKRTFWKTTDWKNGSFTEVTNNDDIPIAVQQIDKDLHIIGIVRPWIGTNMEYFIFFENKDLTLNYCSTSLESDLHDNCYPNNLRAFLQSCDRKSGSTTTTATTPKPKKVKQSLMEYLMYPIIWVVANAIIFFPLLIVVTIVWFKRGKSKSEAKTTASSVSAFATNQLTTRSGVKPNARQSAAGSAVNPSVSPSKAV